MTAINKIKDSTRVAEKALVGSAITAVYKLATVAFPPLAWPVVNTVFKYALDKALYWLSEQGIIIFNTVWVRIQISGEAADLEDARQKAIKAVSGELISDEELDEIDKEMSDAFDKLNRIGRNPL